MRRRPGLVRDAIFKFFAGKQGPVDVAVVYKAVQAELGAEVPQSSVRSYLRLNSEGDEAAFRQVARGKYALRRGRKAE